MPSGFCPVCGMPNCERKHSGRIGWIGLAAYVIVWDITSTETLSAAFARGANKPASRLMVTAGWGVLTLHLFGKIPRRFDPFCLLLDHTRSTHEGPHQRGEGTPA